MNLGYKLFEQDKRTGKLYPLFICKNQETPIGVCVKAEIVQDHKGFAHRPGWHIGTTVPSAPWLMSADGTYKSQRGKWFERVWCLVAYNDAINYTNQVQKLPKKCFVDRLPDNGFYLFRESGNRVWVITDAIQIITIISEEERQRIMNSLGYDEQAEFEPYRQAMVKRMEKNNKKPETYKIIVKRPGQPDIVQGGYDKLNSIIVPAEMKRGLKEYFERGLIEVKVEKED